MHAEQGAGARAGADKVSPCIAKVSVAVSVFYEDLSLGIFFHENRDQDSWFTSYTRIQAVWANSALLHLILLLLLLLPPLPPPLPPLGWVGKMGVEADTQGHGQ